MQPWAWHGRPSQIHHQGALKRGGIDTDAQRWWSFIAPCLGDH